MACSGPADRARCNSPRGLASDRSASRTIAFTRAAGLPAPQSPLGRWTVGVGIFLTPAAVIGTIGDPRLVLLEWVAISLLVVAGAMAFGALGARYPHAGGLYVFLREGWGERLAAVYGWECLLVMDPGVFAALATGVQPYVVAIWPGLAGFERWVALAVIWLVVAVTLAGLRISARTLLAFSDASGQWSHFATTRDQSTPAMPLAPALAVAAISVFFSFGGFWDTSRIADRVRDPRRTLPLTMTLGVGCVALVYILTTAAFIYLLPVSEARDASGCAGRIGARLFGDVGGAVFAAIVLASVLTSALGLAMFAPRLYSAMASDGMLPGVVVGERSGLLMLATLASVLVCTAGSTGILTFFMAPTLVFVALGALSVARGQTLVRLAAVLFAALLVAVVLIVAVNQPLQAGAGFVVTAVGALAMSRVVRGRRVASSHAG